MGYEISEYKGHKVLCLQSDENEKIKVSFGLSKAKLILENIEEIKKFVEGELDED